MCVHLCMSVACPALRLRCEMAGPLPQISGQIHHQPNPSSWHNVALRSLPVAPLKNSVDRSRVDFLYYDGEVPLYDYFYRDYDFDERIDGVVAAPPWTKLDPTIWDTKVATTSWDMGAPTSWNTKGAPTTWDAVAATPWDTHPQEAEEKQTGVSRNSALGGLSWLPRLAILPLLALAWYLAYFIFVENAPTPVVREKRVEEGRGMLGGNVENIMGVLERMDQVLPSFTQVECMEKLNCMFGHDVKILGVHVDKMKKDTMKELGIGGDIEDDEMTECGKWLVKCSPHIWSEKLAASQRTDSTRHLPFSVDTT